MRYLRRLLTVAGWSVLAALVASTVVVIVALAVGYRPVVITTGSMGDAIAPGSLLVAVPDDEVEVGDVLVMRREGRATITHRVIAIEHVDQDRYAITQGDANESPDAEPYALTGEELVGRWSVPKIGSAVATLADTRTMWIIGAVAIILLSVSLLRRIWLGPPVERVLDDDGRPLYPIPASNTSAGSPFTGGSPTATTRACSTSPSRQLVRPTAS